ncbi:hypothetical protein, partial [Actinacidiphila glaucinigra]|uniref:hypothetical protein n=1 Tax=Actinacidiphila glaucinigra TaxID=235986 RepID=UPI00382B9686
VITERRNSMITKACARSVAGVPHRAYLRDLLMITSAICGHMARVRSIMGLLKRSEVFSASEAH